MYQFSMINDVDSLVTWTLMHWLLNIFFYLKS